MSPCLFCQNKRFCHNTQIFNFNIHDYYSNGHSIKGVLLEFFGYQIEGRLQSDDSVCTYCMKIIEHVAGLKRCLLQLLLRDHVEDRKPITFSKKWDIFARSAEIEDDFDNDVFYQSRSPTPSSLLVCKEVVDYPELEERLEEAKKLRDRVCPSTTSVYSTATNTTNKTTGSSQTGKRERKKKRGHNWSRRKISRYTTPSVTTSRPASARSSRPPSARSVCSTGSYRNLPSSQSSRRQSPICDTDDYNNDDVLYYCTDCTFICESLDELSKHKAKRHDNWVTCDKCTEVFMTLSELRKHVKDNHAAQFPCVICHSEFYEPDDLAWHWSEVHVKNSVACRYCGKLYVSEKVVDKHVMKVHKRAAPSRIDYFRAEDPWVGEIEQTILSEKDSFVDLGNDNNVDIISIIAS